MPKQVLYTHKEVAAMFGVRPNTVSELADKLGIEPKAMTNHRAKGLDERDIRRLEKAFGCRAQPLEAAAMGGG